MERLHVKPEAALVLYLVGPDDIDRQIALKKGFQNHNLIGVDIKRSNIKTARAHGGLSIACNALDLLKSWTGSPFDAVYLDTCSSAEIIEQLDPIRMRGIHSDTILALNVQRGRERSISTRHNLMIWQAMGCSTHRAEFISQYWRTKIMATIIIAMHCKGMIELTQLHRSPLFWAEASTKIDLKEFANVINEKMDPRGYSYRSNKVYMDGIVFRSVLGNIMQPQDVDVRLLKKIAALKAVRTMKIANVEDK